MEEILKQLKMMFGIKDYSSIPAPPPMSGNFPSTQPFQVPQDYVKHHNAIANLAYGPLADSLQQLSGKKPYIRIAENMLPSVQGVTDLSQDPREIWFNSKPEAYKARKGALDTPASMSNSNPNDVFIHEFGHIIQDDPKFAKFFGVRRNYVDKDTSKNRLYTKEQDLTSASPPSLKAAARDLDQYYNEDLSVGSKHHEAFSQAFLNAFRFLSATNKDPKMDYRAYLTKLEQNTPGMGMIVGDLLEIPLFKDHPLLKYLAPDVALKSKQGIELKARKKK